MVRRLKSNLTLKQKIILSLIIILIIGMFHTFNHPAWQIEMPILYFLTLIFILAIIDIVAVKHYNLFCPNCNGLSGINLSRKQKIINSILFGGPYHYGKTCPVCNGWGYLRFIKKITQPELIALNKKYGEKSK